MVKITFVDYAVVTDGLWRKSLSAIRSLGKSNFHVTVMGDSFFTTGFWTKFTKSRIYSPTASSDEKNFGISLLSTLKKFQAKQLKPVLFPMEDASLMWVANNIEEVGKYANVILPPLLSLNIAQDKAETTGIAEKLGLPCPKFVKPNNINDFISDLNNLIVNNIKKEFVVKPRTGSGSSGILYDLTLSDEQWGEHWSKYGPLMIQERIPANGSGLGVALLMDQDSQCVASFVHERLQQYPITGGPSTDRRSIHNEELVKWSIQLLQELSWKGIAMVEWKFDPIDNTPKLMEINPRFWGSLELAVRSGVDFPVLYAKLAKGEGIDTVPIYPENVRCRWMIPGDILRYISQSPKDRESIMHFLKGLPTLSEEWDKKDLIGSISCVICPAALFFNPKYWKYLRRRG